METFFYIGLDKLSLSVFEDIDKKIFEKETLIQKNTDGKNSDDLLDKFLEENVIKVEKKFGKFINEINLIIFDPNFVSIQASIKKHGKGDKIDNTDLNRMLFELKQEIKENNIDKTITYMRIDNFILDKKKYLTLQDDFVCNELCLQLDFICLSNKVIDDLSKKIKRYQISIGKIFSEEYLNKYCIQDGEDECQAAAKLKYGNDENEVHLIKKTTINSGFFESFFRFFN
tara:strand:- start:961 stop:1647 length:687 start_codon:yes stop_codon:yes gene_type:complete